MQYQRSQKENTHTHTSAMHTHQLQAVDRLHASYGVPYEYTSYDSMARVLGCMTAVYVV